MSQITFPRLLKRPSRSFFLFGPRGTGKTTWLRQVFPKTLFLDLLDTSAYLDFSRDPHLLDALTAMLKRGSWVVIDEVQKVPALLDEVHRLIATRALKFALSGSSARKLRRGQANMLAGRALTLAMEPLSSAEMGDRFGLRRALEWGLLPEVQLDPKNAAGILGAYVSTYVKEEIREEGILRNVPPFLRFLAIAGQLNGEVINGSNVARDASVPRSTVDTYFSVLLDTLIGHFLPAYQPRAKVRERAHPKFYWFDAGVARAAAGFLHDPPDRVWKGRALETLLYHELRVANAALGRHRPLTYYRTASGSEIDFVVETKKARDGSPAHVVAIEAKLAEKWDRKWERPMRDLSSSSEVRVDRMIAVYTGSRSYRFGELDVLPVEIFLRELHSGRVF